MITEKSPIKFTPMLVVFWAVLLNVLGGIILKAMANDSDLPFVFLIIGIGFVLLINGLRFLVWMYAHKRYPLSTTYPLTSLFFPIMLLVAYFYQEPIEWNQWVGAVLITLGVFWLNQKVYKR